jgi:hypothetical protein
MLSGGPARLRRRFALHGTRRFAMFSTIEYTVVYPVDVKTGCPCQEDDVRETGTSAQDPPKPAEAEALGRHILEAHIIGNTGSAPRRYNSPFFGSWTDTREG